jgi:hypothetical protein
MELPAPVFLGCHTPFFDTSIEDDDVLFFALTLSLSAKT